MVFLIIQSLGSDCVPVEQMLSSGCSAANRPLGTHNPSYYSLPTVFVLPASHCISPWFSTVFVCIFTAFLVAPLSLLYLLRIDYHFVPMIAQFERRMTFLSFGLAPIDQVLAKSAAAEETEEEANWWPTHLQTLVDRQSWRYWQGNSNRNFLDKIKMSFCHCCSVKRRVLVIFILEYDPWDIKSMEMVKKVVVLT